MGGKSFNRIAVISLAMVITAGVSSGDEEYRRERYEVIVDRSPFGADPLSGAAENTAREAAADLAAAKAAEKELRLCFLLESESGDVRAGFENKAAKAGDPKSIMLMVGESFRGMKLLEIDLPNSAATLDRAGSRVTFELSKATAAPAAKTAPKASTTGRFGSGFRRKPPETPEKPPEPELSPEEKAEKRAAVQENLRQYQMEVIRAGMPPLPIPLTAEMDEQLVAEGILPPGE